MNKTQSTIARGLRKRIGADYRLICSRPAGSVSNDEYQAALSDSQQAQGHGAGFWGRTELYADDLGDKLSALCRHARYSAYFYRGWLYFSGV